MAIAARGPVDEIAMLTRRRNEVALMNLERVPHDKAGFGSTVTLREPSGSQIVYQLVMPEDADPDRGLVSVASPIVKARLASRSSSGGASIPCSE